jgi:hypothetical protein
LRLSGLGLALILAGCGGGGSANPEPNPGPQRGTLTGTVRNASGEALGGVAVLLGQSPATTDTGGQFVYSNLLSGSYTLSLQDGSGDFDCRNVAIGSGNVSLDFTLPRSGSGLAATDVEPALNSVNVPLDASLHLSFNSALDFASVSADDFTITPPIGEFAVRDHEPGPLGPSGGGDIQDVWLVPELQLPADQVTYIEVSGEIRDSDGQSLNQPVRWRFRTSASDSYPPRLLSTTPAGYPPNSPVRFEYSETLAAPDAQTVVTVTPDIQTTAYASGRSLIVSAPGRWEINTEYTITVGNVADESGNRATDNGATISFITGEQASPTNYVEPEWNRALDLIFFSADQGGSYDVFSIDPETLALEQRTTLGGDEREPTVSSDGSLLAFQHRDAGGKWSIWVQSLDGGEAQEITSGDYNDTQPQFSRTISDKIIFVSDRSTPRGLYLMNADGSNPVEQDRDFSQAQTDPALHPLLDTQMLFAAGGSGDRDIWRKTVSAVDGSVINQNFSQDTISDEYRPDWGPEADFIVYISNYSGTANLWYAEATGEFDVQLTSFDTPVLSVSVEPLAGGGRGVVSVADGSGGSQLIIVDLVSGEPLVYLTGEEAGN